MTTAFFAAHEAMLLKALQAIRARTYWSAYPELPSGRIYGETARHDGEVAFQSYLGRQFDLDQPGRKPAIGEERSPYGIELGITYEAPDMEALILRAVKAMPAWRDAGPDARAGVCLEILHRLNRRSFELAFAVMHTTGQGFMMAFQAGGPHAQDRGLEAVAYAYEAMKSAPDTVVWEKPQGKNPPLLVEKTFKAVPRGVALVVGCSTFPTWNGYPGLFASLVTGNPVIVKPHPAAILPLAITVKLAREVLAEAGFDENLVTLAVDTAAHPITKEIATRPEVRIIDFTGSSVFGNWLEADCAQAQVYTEKSGVNAIVIDDFDDLKGMARNLAFTLSLYSGQMCTTPQNIFIPAKGIKGPEGHLSFKDVAKLIAGSIDKFLSDPERAVEVLGAIQSPATLQRLEAAASLGEIVLESRAIAHPHFPNATIRTPVVVAVDADQSDAYETECFGPVTFLIRTKSTEDSLAEMERTIQKHGAITAAIYSSQEETLQAAREVALRVGVNLSENLTGGLFVNQSAAFSDFHATGGNPAANASLTDHAFVANRFRVVEMRRMLPVPAEGA